MKADTGALSLLSGKCWHVRNLYSHTPIIFYSAAAYEVDRKTAMQSGAQGYLVKPTANGELAGLVNELIVKSLEQREAVTAEP